MGLLNNLLGRNNQKQQGSALPPLPPIGGGNQTPAPMQGSAPAMMNSFNPQSSITPEDLANSDNQFLQNSTVGAMPSLGQGGTKPVAPPMPLNDLNKPPISDNDSVLGNMPLGQNDQNQYNKDWYKANEDLSQQQMPGSAPVAIPNPAPQAQDGMNSTQNLLQTPAGEIKEIVGPPMQNDINQAQNDDIQNLQANNNPPMQDMITQDYVQPVIEEVNMDSQQQSSSNEIQDLVTGTALEPVPSDVTPVNDLPAPEPIAQIQQTESNPTSVPEPLNQIDVSVNTFDQPIQTNEQQISTPIVEEKPEVLPALEPEKPKVTITPKLKRTFFNVIGLLGLNGPNVDPNLAGEVSKIINHFSQNKIKAIFDSKNGLGQSVINEINKTDLWNEGVYFMPFMSGLSNSANTKPDQNSKVNSVIYSNLFDRLDYMVANSKLFVVFNSGGVNNLAQLSMVWTLSYLYQGQNKPVILFGSGWGEALNSLKSTFGVSDLEMESVHIVSNFEEFAAKLTELESKYKSLIKPQYKGKVLDRRVEGDEGEFLIK